MPNVDEDDEPIEWERFKFEVPREGFVPLDDVAEKLAEKRRWSKKRVQRVYAELVAEKELIVRADGRFGLNNALNRAAAEP